MLLGVATSPMLNAPLHSWLAPQLPRLSEGAAAASIASISFALVGILLGRGGYASRVPPRLRDAVARTLSLDAPTLAIAATARSTSAALAALDARGPDRVGRAVTSLGAAVFRGAGAFDRRTFDVAVTRVAAGSAALFDRSAVSDGRRVDAAFDAAAQAIRNAGDRWRRVQTGALEHYLVALGVWLFLVTGAGGAILVAVTARP